MTGHTKNEALYESKDFIQKKKRGEGNSRMVRWCPLTDTRVDVSSDEAVDTHEVRHGREWRAETRTKRGFSDT